MTSPIVFHVNIEEEVKEAYRWYEKKREGLGEDFLGELEKVYERLSHTPEAHQVIHQDVRRALSRRFPYAVYYRGSGRGHCRARYAT